MFLFYAPQISESGICQLPENESFHCAKVLRMRPGQALRLTDGNGLLCDAELAVVDARCCAAQVIRVLKRPDEEGNTRPPVHIVMAPTKNMDRTEWFLEKAIEVGLGRASFVQCARSERKSLKMERLEAIAVSAMTVVAYVPAPHRRALQPGNVLGQGSQGFRHPLRKERSLPPRTGNIGHSPNHLTVRGKEKQASPKIHRLLRPGIRKERLPETVGPEG